MIHRVLPTGDQTAKLAPVFSKSHGKPRTDDRRGWSRITFINRNGLRWRETPDTTGSHKTLYCCWSRWSEKGMFAQMMVGLAAARGRPLSLFVSAGQISDHIGARALLSSLPRVDRLLEDRGCDAGWF